MNFKIRNKKGFQVGKIFIYILALFIMAFILYFSYNAIIDLMENKEKADYTLFKAEFENHINTIARNPGNVLYPNIAVPSYVEKVCFSDLDLAQKPATPSYCLKQHKDKGFDKFMCDAWISETRNIFLLPEKSGIGKAIKNTLISLNEPVVCINVRQGSVEIKLTGKGKRVLIEVPEPEY